MSGNSSTSPRAALARRPSNPFTKNQDERDFGSSPPMGSLPSSSSLIARFRNASVGSNNSDTIEEQDDEDLKPVPFRDGVPAPESVKLGSAQGAGTGVFETASQAPDSAKIPEGLPFRPTLRPAGGNQRHVSTDGLADSNKLYQNDQDESVDPRGTGRRRGVVRTYSMAQQKRRPVIMNDDRIIRQRRLSQGELQR
jgi:alpha,alpha-trehalase